MVSLTMRALILNIFNWYSVGMSASYVCMAIAPAFAGTARPMHKHRRREKEERRTGAAPMCKSSGRDYL